MIMSVDPWSSKICPSPSSDTEVVKVFEDDFVRGNSLPDSDAYVAVLERKLAKIKQGKPHAEKALIESLEEKRRDCIVRLLAEDFSVSDSDPVNEEDIPTKWLRSYINPQQPLSVGELVELVKADYLAKSVEEEQTCELANMTKIKGKKVLCIVTGASRGIGKTIAVALSKLVDNGSEFKLLARSKNGLQATSNEILSSNSKVVTECIEYDLSVPNIESFTSIVKSKQNLAFDVYLLVHNAGTEGNSCLANQMSDLAEWQKYMSLNFFSMSLLTSAFLSVHTSGARLIINITSLAAIQPFKSLGYYCVGKAAREMYLRTLAEENSDVDILNYSPGPVETDMIDRVINTAQDDEVRKAFVSMKENGTLVKLEDTVGKLIEIVESGRFTSGGRVDYFDDK